MGVARAAGAKALCAKSPSGATACIKEGFNRAVFFYFISDKDYSGMQHNHILLYSGT